MSECIGNPAAQRGRQASTEAGPSRRQAGLWQAGRQIRQAGGRQHTWADLGEDMDEGIVWEGPAEGAVHYSVVTQATQAALDGADACRPQLLLLLLLLLLILLLLLLVVLLVVLLLLLALLLDGAHCHRGGAAAIALLLLLLLLLQVVWGECAP